MYRRIRVIGPALGLAAATLLAACDNLLPVDNVTQPDVDRALATPSLVETAISKYFQQLHQGIYGTSSSVWPGTMVMAFESSSQLGNFEMGTRAAIPRTGIENHRGNSYESEKFRVFDHLQRNGRQAANAILVFNKFIAAGNGSATGNAARDARAKSVAFFSVAWALGQLSITYDSAAITTPDAVAALPSADTPLPLSGAAQVNAAALRMLDSALSYAGTSSAITAGWLAQSADVSTARWQQIIRSYRAKFRAGVARTPAERAAVNWQAVIDDANAGITSDFAVNLSPASGWTNSWIQQAAVDPGWHQMTPFIIGMADTSGTYASWLQTPLMTRSAILIRTPDLRFPQGNDRATQSAVTGNSRVVPTGSKIYFRNRPSGEDTPNFPWGTSMYDHIRFGFIRAGGGNGAFPMITAAENNMLAAEGYLRLPTPNIAAAAALIDKTRVPNGLPAVTGMTSMTAPVPGGNACVPRVPSGNSTACGTIFEAMKWEKRMETAFTGYAQWWVDSRGWGDLVAGTPLEYMVPYQELDARRQAIYNQVRTAATSNTYGF